MCFKLLLKKKKWYQMYLDVVDVICSMNKLYFHWVLYGFHSRYANLLENGFNLDTFFTEIKCSRTFSL